MIDRNGRRDSYERVKGEIFRSLSYESRRPFLSIITSQLKPMKGSRRPVPLSHAQSFKRKACFEHSDLFKVNTMQLTDAKLITPAPKHLKKETTVLKRNPQKE